MEWSADGLSQDELMMKDECLVVNYNDEVVGHENKYNVHKFVVGQPKGIVHRAFSVMLFDDKGRLLLQQRASSKITFADAWTNTCCSHPLYGMAASEVDSPQATMKGDPLGVKRAAVRKLKHELGIEGLAPERFVYKTRVHYWASDEEYGPKSPWGEHEIDYLLLCQLKEGEKLIMKPHPEEVKETMWVGKDELFKLMKEKPQGMERWSPWFCIIAEKFMKQSGWWDDLEGACDPKKNTMSDFKTIHRFDCSKDPEKLIGAGGALPFLDALEKRLLKSSSGESAAASSEMEQMLVDIATTTSAVENSKKKKMDSGKKQGAYGRVATHKTSTAKGFDEWAAALRFKVLPGLTNNASRDDPDVQFCDDMLGKVSRSFAAVIRQLPPNLCLEICVFYLVLRALDTVEDDMTAYKGREAEKIKELREFGAKRLYQTDCSITGVGEADEAVLIENFGAVSRVFLMLPEASQKVIRQVTDEMGGGMADYVSAELAQGTADMAAYNLYCHAVAGLVGEGLTQIFVAGGWESTLLEGQGEQKWPFATKKLGLANSMGLFLQKTNIIRDYLEDYVDGRAFWPRTMWTKHATTGDLGEFARPTARISSTSAGVDTDPAVSAIIDKGGSSRALDLLDELVADALELVPDSLNYLALLRTPSVYRFCAIPQVMAIATLTECYANPKLFTGVVKIRKGMAAQLILDSRNGHDSTLQAFNRFAKIIIKKAAGGDTPLRTRVREQCDAILKITDAATKRRENAKKKRILGSIALVALAVAVVVKRRIAA